MTSGAARRHLTGMHLIYRPLRYAAIGFAAGFFGMVFAHFFGPDAGESTNWGPAIWAGAGFAVLAMVLGLWRDARIRRR